MPGLLLSNFVGRKLKVLMCENNKMQDIQINGAYLYILHEYYSIFIWILKLRILNLKWK